MRVTRVKKTYLSNSVEDTEKIAFDLATTLQPGSVVAFFGDLGAGKTTFIKSLISKLSSISKDEVSSPTFVYLNIYPSSHLAVYHFDLYRINSKDEFLLMGFQEYFDAGGVTLIEWSERIEELLPAHTIRVELEYAGEYQREVSIITHP